MDEVAFRLTICINEMFRFLINWDFNPLSLCEDVELLTSFKGVLKLNEEWTLTVEFRETKGLYLMPKDINIHRKTAGEEVAISGALSIQLYGFDGKIVWKNIFTKLMESESQFETLFQLHLGISDLYPFGREPDQPTITYFLHGNINIISISQKSDITFKIGECGTRVQMKSLVELNEFEGLLHRQNRCYSDVNLICGSESIPAHMDILSAKSPVFAAMFRNPTKESHKKEVDVSDLDASVLRAMLTFMYMEKTFNLTLDSASKLLIAAKNYQIRDLEKVCCDFLKENISFRNILKIVVLGDMHDTNLKYFAVDYICKHIANFWDLAATDEWITLKKKQPAIAVDILTCVLRSKDDKIAELSSK